jgi:phospholipid/cholesterol/gamma-HCH transport system substrate-binding protein
VNKETKVGLFAIISIAIFYFGFNYLKGIDFFSSSSKYYAIYNNIDGLNISNPVIVNGYAIGRVSDIRILQKRNNRVLVELDVKSDLIIGQGTTATLMNSDFLGSKAILLEIGDTSKPVAKGDTLKSDVDKGLAALMERAQPLTDDIGLTISRMNEILLGMEGAGEEIIGTLAALRKTTQTANAFIRTANTGVEMTLNNVAGLTQNINGKVSKLDPILSNANSTLEKINAVELDSTLLALNASLIGLQGILEGLNSGEGTLGKVLKNDSLHTNLNQMLIDLDKLLIHFDENPKHFLGPLGKSKKKIANDRAKEGN